MSCLTLLKTTVNSICSGISHTSVSSVHSEVHAALSAGASICDFSPSTLGFSTVLLVPLANEFGSQFSVVSPFSDAVK